MNERLGRCYELAWKEATNLWLTRYRQRDVTLIHGVIRDTHLVGKGAVICHAWVRVNAEHLQFVWEPITEQRLPESVFMSLYDAEIIHEYTVSAAIELANDTGHSGPWHPMPKHLQRTLTQIEQEKQP